MPAISQDPNQCMISSTYADLKYLVVAYFQVQLINKCFINEISTMGACAVVQRRIQMNYRHPAQAYIQPSIKQQHQTKTMGSIQYLKHQKSTSLGNSVNIQFEKEEVKVFKKQTKLDQTIRQFESELTDLTIKMLTCLRKLNKSENPIEIYFDLVQRLLQGNRKYKVQQAIFMLEAILILQIQLKKVGEDLYIEDQAEVYSKLATLEATRSKIYQQYLNKANSIFDSSIQYFLDQKIAVINNVALAVQQSYRQQRFEQAIKLLKQSIEFQQRFVLVKDERIYYAKVNLACAYYEIKQTDEGAKLFKSIIDELSKQKQQRFQELIQIAERNSKYYHDKYSQKL